MGGASPRSGLKHPAGWLPECRSLYGLSFSRRAAGANPSEPPNPLTLRKQA